VATEEVARREAATAVEKAAAEKAAAEEVARQEAASAGAKKTAAEEVARQEAERGLKQTMENEIDVMTATLESRTSPFFFRLEDNYLDLEILLAHTVTLEAGHTDQSLDHFARRLHLAALLGRVQWRELSVDIHHAAKVLMVVWI
jgi:hypothetical protein